MEGQNSKPFPSNYLGSRFPLRTHLFLLIFGTREQIVKITSEQQKVSLTAPVLYHCHFSFGNNIGKWQTNFCIEIQNHWDSFCEHPGRKMADNIFVQDYNGWLRKSNLERNGDSRTLFQLWYFHNRNHQKMIRSELSKSFLFHMQ